MRAKCLTLLAVLLGLTGTATATDEPRQPGWGESEAFPVYLRVAVQSTLPASFVFEVLKPTFAHLRRTLPYARISVERLPPAELHQAVRTQGVHAFVADSGFFGDLQARGWAEQIAAHQPQGVLDPAYVSGMAVVRDGSPYRTLSDLNGSRLLSDSPENFGTWMIFEGELARDGLLSERFTRHAAFNDFIAPMPLESLAKGGGDAALVEAVAYELIRNDWVDQPPSTSTASVTTKKRCRRENKVKLRIPVFLWTDAILRGREMDWVHDGVKSLPEGARLGHDIKMIVNSGGNVLINQHSDTSWTDKVLRDTTKCEFIVVCDKLMTPSARYADILLPDTLGPETDDIVGNGDSMGNLACLYPMHKAAEPQYDQKPSWEIGRLIAKELGIEEKYTEGRDQKGGDPLVL